MIPGALLKVVEKQTIARQPQWNIHEAVVLLVAYLEAQRKERPRAHIVREVSAALRQMAQNQGLLIDDIYRNENGISYQLQSMESAFRGENIYVPATKLFAEVVSLYNKNRSRFDSLLEEAREMIDQHNNKEAFLSWASSVMPEKQYKWLDDNLLHVEQYAKAKGLICGSIYTVSDLSTLFAKLEENYALGTIRVSLGKDNTEECVKRIVEAIIRIFG